MKNPDSTHENCKIKYHDIGDYLTREKKLETLHEAVSISGVSDWDTITPDEHHDWIDQRSKIFPHFYPIGSERAREGKVDDAIFGLYSLGLATSRDTHIYNFSRYVCAENAEKITMDYLNALSEITDNPKLTVDEVSSRHSSYLKWSPELKKKLERRIETEYKDSFIRKVAYRPYISTNCFANYTFIQRKYQMDKIFPDSSSKNRVICVPGKGWKNQFSVLVTDSMTDLNLNEAGSQCFPRYRYQKTADFFEDRVEELERVDNISKTALKAFQEHYSDNTITKDDIFDYVYGILHSSSYREQFTNDLSKMLPRIPYAPDFTAFAEAGYKLAELHLNYETCEQYPLTVEFPNITPSPANLEDVDPNLFLLTEKAMRYADIERRSLNINDHVCLTGIPEDAHRYIVNGRSPLEWFIDRYKIKTDSDSGIVNDPNGWFPDPRDLVTAIKRIVYVSVESARIIDGLPDEITGE